MKNLFCLALVLGTVCLGSFRADAVTWYVATNGNDAAVGTNWVTALKTIQVAVNKAGNGDTVIVSNGLYNTGGRHKNPLYTGDLSNRVAITNAILVQSVNGPNVTTIQGSTPSQTYLRCVYLASNATMTGFTLTGGLAPPVDRGADSGGGGAFCEDGAILSNCTITGNSTYDYGGGVYRGTLIDCLIASNSVSQYGGGCYESTLINCQILSNSGYYGGGAYRSTLTGCTLRANSAYNGGGAYNGWLYNCTVSSNVCDYGDGGGVYGTLTSDMILTNCVLIGNTAARGGGAYSGKLSACALFNNNATDQGGGVHSSIINNSLLVGNAAAFGGGAYVSTITGCTIYENTAGTTGGGIYNCNGIKNSIVYSNTPNNYAVSFMTDCCTRPYSPGNMSGKIVTNDPQLVNSAAGNYRLSSTSPCINAGSNAWVVGTTDLDGRARISQSIVDMGAYEYNPDGDGDGLMDTDEIIAGTDPLSASSVFRVSGILPNTPGLQFDSVTGRLYSVDYNNNLVPDPQVWTPFTSNIPGTGGPISINTPADSNGNYRIRVQLEF